jgi:hypothetical protein
MVKLVYQKGSIFRKILQYYLLLFFNNNVFVWEKVRLSEWMQDNCEAFFKPFSNVKGWSWTQDHALRECSGLVWFKIPVFSIPSNSCSWTLQVYTMHISRYSHFKLSSKSYNMEHWTNGSTVNFVKITYSKCCLHYNRMTTNYKNWLHCFVLWKVLARQCYVSGSLYILISI